MENIILLMENECRHCNNSKTNSYKITMLYCTKLYDVKGKFLSVRPNDGCTMKFSDKNSNE